MGKSLDKYCHDITVIMYDSGSMNAFFERHQLLKDILGIIGFILAVVIGAALINQLFFRSFSVSGPSMEPTLFTADRLIVNRLPMTWSAIRGSTYKPERGHVIVFRNPHWQPGGQDEFIVKRVVAFPGERVDIVNDKLVVYNDDNPGGLVFDDKYEGPTSPSSTGVGIPTTVPDGEIFVAGDHRQDGYSLDSRNGLGTIPYNDIVGPVSMRIFPFSHFKTF